MYFIVCQGILKAVQEPFDGIFIFKNLHLDNVIKECGNVIKSYWRATRGVGNATLSATHPIP